MSSTVGCGGGVDLKDIGELGGKDVDPECCSYF